MRALLLPFRDEHGVQADGSSALSPSLHAVEVKNNNRTGCTLYSQARKGLKEAEQVAAAYRLPKIPLSPHCAPGVKKSAEIIPLYGIPRWASRLRRCTRCRPPKPKPKPTQCKTHTRQCETHTRSRQPKPKPIQCEQRLLSRKRTKPICAPDAPDAYQGMEEGGRAAAGPADDACATPAPDSLL